MEKVQAGCLKKGSLVMIKGKPCKVTEFSTAKTGKHGAAKAMVTGLDIFTGNKLECTFSTGENVDAPVVSKAEYQLVDIDDDGFCSLMLDNGDIKQDLKLPDDEKELCENIKGAFGQGEDTVLVTVLSALGMEK